MYSRDWYQTGTYILTPHNECMVTSLVGETPIRISFDDEGWPVTRHSAWRSGDINNTDSHCSQVSLHNNTQM